MAKVDGPLMSLGARGKIADAIVFFPWKGKHVVRQWLKPTNKKSAAQGYIRSALKAISRFISTIDCIAKGGSVDSTLYQAATAAVPAGTNWNAWLGQGFLDLIQVGGVLATTAFANLIAAYSSLGTAVLAAYQTNATALTLEDFAFEYGYTANIEAGFQLFAGAKAAYQQDVVGAGIATTDPVSWAASDIDAFKTDCVA